MAAKHTQRLLETQRPEVGAVCSAAGTLPAWPGSLNSVLNPVFRRFAGFCKRQLAESGPPADAGGESGVTRCGAG